MLLPSTQYGPSIEVKKRTRKIIARIIRGEALLATMLEDGLLDTAITPGLLLLGGATRGGDVNFHTGLLWVDLGNELGKLDDDAADAIEERIFTESITTAWGVLGLMSPNGESWLVSPKRHQPFLDAVVRFWSELAAVGDRFCYGEPRDIWRASAALHFVLARRGVPTERLTAPLPPGGLPELLRTARMSN